MFILANIADPDETQRFWGLQSDSTSVLEDEPGKLDIKRRKPGFLFISLQISPLIKLAIVTSLSIFMSNQRHGRRHLKCNVGKDTCREIGKVDQVNVH